MLHPAVHRQSLSQGLRAKDSTGRRMGGRGEPTTLGLDEKKQLETISEAQSGVLLARALQQTLQNRASPAHGLEVPERKGREPPPQEFRRWNMTDLVTQGHIQDART